MNFNDTEGVYTYTFEAERKVQTIAFHGYLTFSPSDYMLIVFAGELCGLQSDSAAFKLLRGLQASRSLGLSERKSDVVSSTYIKISTFGSHTDRIIVSVS